MNYRNLARRTVGIGEGAAQQSSKLGKAAVVLVVLAVLLAGSRARRK